MSEWLTKQEAIKFLGVHSRNFDKAAHSRGVYSNSKGLYNVEKLTVVLAELEKRRHPLLKEVLPEHILTKEMCEISGVNDTSRVSDIIGISPVGRVGRAFVYDRAEFMEKWQPAMAKWNQERQKNGADRRKKVHKFTPKEREKFPLATAFLSGRVKNV